MRPSIQPLRTSRSWLPSGRSVAATLVAVVVLVGVYAYVMSSTVKDRVNYLFVGPPTVTAPVVPMVAQADLDQATADKKKAESDLASAQKHIATLEADLQKTKDEGAHGIELAHREGDRLRKELLTSMDEAKADKAKVALLEEKLKALEAGKSAPSTTEAKPPVTTTPASPPTAESKPPAAPTAPSKPPVTADKEGDAKVIEQAAQIYGVRK